MPVNTISETSFISNQHLIISNTNSHYGYQPLTSGNIAPSFVIPVQHGLLNSSLGTSVKREAYIALQDFIDYGQPLVILFTGVASRNTLNGKKLVSLQENIQAQGGRLLILTPVDIKYLKRQLGDSGILSIFHDKDNLIAEAFGLFDEQNALWQWASGIEPEEETLSALYVIAPDRRIVFHYVDFSFLLQRNNNFELMPFVGQLLDKVYNVSQQYRPQKEHRLVS